MTTTSLFRLLFVLATVVVCAFAQAPAKPESPAPPAAQQAAPAAEPKKEEPKYDMGVVRLTLAKKTGATVPNEQEVWQQHVDYWLARVRERSALAVGQLQGHPQWVGLSVLRVTDAEADKIVAEDPAVKVGLLATEAYKWFTARNLFQPPKEPVTWKTWYFGFLVRGEKWTPGVTGETKQLQAAHMANINRLAESGELVIAGPMSEAGNWRGIFIFFTPTIEHARELAATDPMAKVGRLKIDIYPLELPDGVLLEPRSK